MNISAPFIRRPIATFLLAAGLLLLGGVVYGLLPVATLPSINLPIVQVSAGLPGASPKTMAATVAAPLERHLGKIPGVQAMTSSNTRGRSRISLQFDISRDVNAAAQDVRAAVNAASADLPAGMPRAPRVSKRDPSDFPILVLALTSRTLTAKELYHAADTVLAQRLAQVRGVSDVHVTGGEERAIRVDLKPQQLARLDLGMDAVRRAIGDANVTSPLGGVDGSRRHYSLTVNDSLRRVEGYRHIVVRNEGGKAVHLKDVARVRVGSRNRLRKGWYDGHHAVLLILHRAPGANVVATVNRIKDLLPGLDRWISSGVKVSIFADQTRVIKAGVQDLQFTLMASIALVMLVVLFFLRRGVPVLAAGVTVPLSLAGTVVLMWWCGFSLNSLTLMALTISVGFVVDDAIVMIENIHRNMEAGMRPLRASFRGARQIGFTVVAISASLVAVFIPLLFMGGIPGLLLRQFSLTLAFAIVISAFVSLSVTPMICSRFLKREEASRQNRLARACERSVDRLTGAYAASLRPILRYRWLMLGVTLGALGLMGLLFVQVPKVFLPQGDSNLLIGVTRSAPDASFARMVALQKQVSRIIRQDPAVAHLGTSVGSGGGFTGGGNSGLMFVSLKPAARRSATASQVIDRLRPKLKAVQGARVFLHAAGGLPGGVHRSNRGQYQLTLWSPDLDVLTRWVSRVNQRMRKIPGLRDVSTNRDEGGPRVRVRIDRDAAARLHVSVVAIDTALNDAFTQRRISTIYNERNQYRVVLGVLPKLQSKVADLHRIHVSATDGEQVPLSAITGLEMGTAPLAVHHDGQFPSISISYNLVHDQSAGAARERIKSAVAALHPPDKLHVKMGGEARRMGAGSGLLLIVSALIAVYLVLGILYESLIHPLTILSTLPSAGLGAILALYFSGTELSLISVLGVVLLIGIVKKNGIMLVDFALEAERKRGLAPEQAIFEAARERFRPITMTTMAAVLVALPLVIASGPGAELRRPLGITIIGGLIVSQFLTIYSTPVFYLLLDRLRRQRRYRPIPRLD